MSLSIKKIPKPKDENLKLKELNPMLMKYFTNTLFIAPTGVGKTNLIINLLDRPRFYKNKFDKIVLFSNTYYSDNIWKSCKSIDEENVHIDYSDDVLEQIIEEQISSKNDDEPLNTLIIFDDIIQQISKHKSLINKLIMRNRHYYLTICITTQKYSLVSPTIRNNTAYFVLFGITIFCKLPVKSLLVRLLILTFGTTLFSFLLFELNCLSIFFYISMYFNIIIIIQFVFKM